MRRKQNLHTHSTWCDGVDTPEEMILTAMEMGYDSIGFSGHSYMPYSPLHAGRPDNTALYKQEIRTLQKKYAGQIDVFCGLEVEMLSGADMSGYDYLIGSVHYLRLGGDVVGFDRSAECVRGVIDAYFGGDGMAYAKKYYEYLAELPAYGRFDILGHADLITKHAEKADFFDTDSPEYRRAAIEAIEALAGKIPYFEVNTGAVARGYRTSPYPAPFLLRELRRLGFGAVITSDCHDRRMLDCFRPEAEELLRECGFREAYVLGPSGFYPQTL